MGNAQGGYRAAVLKLEGHFAEWNAEEDRLIFELKELIKAGGDPKTGKGKELSHELARYNGRIRGLSTGLDKQSVKLKEEERRLVSAMREQQQQATGQEGVDDQLAAQLLQARKSCKDFEKAAANLRKLLRDRKATKTFLKLLYDGINPAFFECFRKAIQHDNNRDYEEALRLYQEGILQATQSMMKLNDGDKRKPLIQERLKVYSKRVKELQDFLQNQKLAAGQQQQQQQNVRLF